MVKLQIIALSMSSIATLPTNIKVCEEQLNVSEATSGFALPFGSNH